ncbi:glycine N-methyltransferase isoform X2 [Nomascus leucogenys]|uniref:glycine N-methyltransferase isoform X2 n=1 Tax=Nomascus leucogenys TaxID=61853 RepID=UPI00122DB2DB|nr:glycine N-methyltransferase isoform X2 [Nomascus leucogenys]
MFLRAKGGAERLLRMTPGPGKMILSWSSLHLFVSRTDVPPVKGADMLMPAFAGNGPVLPAWRSALWISGDGVAISLLPPLLAPLAFSSRPRLSGQRAPRVPSRRGIAQRAGSAGWLKGPSPGLGGSALPAAGQTPKPSPQLDTPKAQQGRVRALTCHWPGGAVGCQQCLCFKCGAGGCGARRCAGWWTACTGPAPWGWQPKGSRTSMRTGRRRACGSCTSGTPAAAPPNTRHGCSRCCASTAASGCSTWPVAPGEPRPGPGALHEIGVWLSLYRAAAEPQGRARQGGLCQPGTGGTQGPGAGTCPAEQALRVPLEARGPGSGAQGEAPEKGD